MTRRLYIYYRVDAGAGSATVAAVAAMQQRLTLAHPGLHAELLRRPPQPGRPVTLMEVYAAAAGVDEPLAAAIEAAAQALPALRGVERHVEVFEATGG
jgi:peptidoglycan hydrolase-like protein with peptidoglycan-binding domain